MIRRNSKDTKSPPVHNIKLASVRKIHKRVTKIGTMGFSDNLSENSIE